MVGGGIGSAKVRLWVEEEGGASGWWWASAGGRAVAVHEVAIVTTRAPRGVSALVEEAVVASPASTASPARAVVMTPYRL